MAQYRHIVGTGTFKISGVNLADEEVCLDRIIINKPLANGVLTVYDENDANASSDELIAQITYPGTLLNDQPTSVEFGCMLNKGLTIKIAGAALDVTVIYT